MERQKSLRELDEKELEIRAQSRLSCRGSKGHTHKTGGGGGGRARSTSPISKLLAESYDAEQVNTNRESLMQTLTETEFDLSAVNRQIDLVKETLRILIRVSERVQEERGRATKNFRPHSDGATQATFNKSCAIQKLDETFANEISTMKKLSTRAPLTPLMSD